MTEPSIDNDNDGGNNNYLVKNEPKKSGMGLGQRIDYILMFSIFYSDFLMSKVQKSLFLLISIRRYANQNSCVKSVIIGLISGAAGAYMGSYQQQWEPPVSRCGRKAESCLEPATLPLSHLQLRHEASCRALWQTEQEPPRGCC